MLPPVSVICARCTGACGVLTIQPVMLSGDGPLVDVLPDGQTVEQIMDEASGGDGLVSFSDFRNYLAKIEEGQRSSSEQLATGKLEKSKAILKPGAQMLKSKRTLDSMVY